MAPVPYQRVTFSLPCRNKSGEVHAIFKIVGYLRKRQAVSGYTYSDINHPVFYGYWRDESANKWTPDFIVLFTVDYPSPSVERPFSLDEELAHLKQAIANAYKEHGSTQKELWITSHNVFLQP